VKLLLDTHALLWAVFNDPALGQRAKRAILSETSQLFLSMASAWEMATKVATGKLKLTEPIDKFVASELGANRITMLDIHLRHIARYEKLPFHHRDPFDRLLIAQALDENLAILSADRHFDAYGVKRIW
jgi:PIN domain nuclease of toxin-antitoxin system